MFIRSLLADAGELVAPEGRDKRWASNARTTFEEAISMLQKPGVFKTAQWPDGFGPNDIDREKGWVDPWLNARICIRTSISAGAKIAPSSNRRVQPKGAGRHERFQITGSEIRFARNNIIPRWSQEELAQELGIARSYLSQIEGDKRKPSSALVGRLRAWIDSRRKAEGARGIFDEVDALRLA